MEQLLAEKQMLIRERENLSIASENERRIAVNFINAKLNLLNDRIAEARIIDPKGNPQDEIRFGALVTIKNEGSGKIQTFQIVGVDEADIARGKIAFNSPLAKGVDKQEIGRKGYF